MVKKSTPQNTFVSSVQVRLFIKCSYCGHTLYTTKITRALSLVTQSHEGNDILSCGACNKQLNRTDLFLCSSKENEWCSSCKVRFMCYSEPY